MSAELCEVGEVMRIMSLPADHFAKRNQAKNDVGLLAVGKSGAI